jgi:hypothetical protein
LLPDGTQPGHFGGSVSLSGDGDTALVGASFADGAGAAYVFVRSGASWTEQTKLLPSDRVYVGEFGYKTSLMSASGDTAVVTSFHSDRAFDTGSAFVFVRSDAVWTEQAKLVAAEAGESYGSSVSLSASGDTLLISAWGMSFVFVRSGASWTEQVTLIPSTSDGPARWYFGVSASLSADGDVALVGAPWASDQGPQAGSAFVFVRSGASWTETGEIASTPVVDRAEFGESVSLDASGGVALVGAWNGKNDQGSTSGSAYVITQQCDPGQFGLRFACQVCPAGSFCPGRAAAPTVCEAGEYCPDEGASVRGGLCPAGSYCSTPTTRTGCPAGSFCAEGAAAPTACETGKYCPANSTDAADCPAGSVCATPASSATCPSGKFCPSGSTEATACSTCPSGDEVATECTATADTVCVATKTDSDLTMIFIFAGAGLVAVLLLGLAARCVVRKRAREAAMVEFASQSKAGSTA